MPVTKKIVDMPSFVRFLFPGLSESEDFIPFVDADGNAFDIRLSSGQYFDKEGVTCGDVVDIIKSRWTMNDKDIFFWLKDEGWLASDVGVHPFVQPKQEKLPVVPVPVDIPVPNQEYLLDYAKDLVSKGLIAPLVEGSDVKVHEYRYDDGRIAILVVRYATVEGKAIRRLIWDGDGWSWSGSRHRTNFPLYNMQEIAASPDVPVFVFEGEKAVDAFMQMGDIRSHFRNALATCPIGGGCPQEGTDWSVLSGRLVYLVPDYDEEGEKFLYRVGKHLDRVFPRRVVHIPASTVYQHWFGYVGEPPVGWDIADALVTG